MPAAEAAGAAAAAAAAAGNPSLMVPLTTDYLLLATYYLFLLANIYYLLLTTDEYLLLTTYYSVFSTHCLPRWAARLWACRAGECLRERGGSRGGGARQLGTPRGDGAAILTYSSTGHTYSSPRQ